VPVQVYSSDIEILSRGKPTLGEGVAKLAEGKSVAGSEEKKGGDQLRIPIRQFLCQLIFERFFHEPKKAEQTSCSAFL